MSELVGVPPHKLEPGDEHRCGTAAHHGKRRPKAEYRLERPQMNPPLPGPRYHYVCRDCMGEFMMRTAAFTVVP